MPFLFVKEVHAVCFLAALLTLSGCAGTHEIAPREQGFENQALATDAAIQSANRDAQWPSAQWWRAYRDPQLDAWIETALADSPTLAQAQARVRMALSVAGVVEAAEAPHVSGDLSLKAHHWPNDFFYGPGELAKTTTWNNVAALGLSYALDFWGRERNNTERYLNLAQMAAAEARIAQLELEGNIVRAYIRLSLQYAELDSERTTLLQQEQILSLAQRRLAGGLGTRLEASHAEVPLPETRRRIAAIEEAIAISRNQLAALAGKGPGAGASLTRPQLVLADQPSLPSALPLELVGHRPDIVASRWKVAAEARGIDVAQAEFYPNIDLLANIGYSAVQGNMLSFLSGQKLSYGIGAAVSLPIFDGGRLRAQLGAVSAGYDTAVAQYNQTLVNALKSISDELIRMRSLETQQQLAEQSSHAARKVHDLATQAYRAGLTDYLNALEAQVRLSQLRLIEQRIHAARLLTHAELNIALGGGLLNEDDTAPNEQMLPASIGMQPVKAR